MENLYTVQKAYESLAGPIQEHNHSFFSEDYNARIFNSESSRQMYCAGLTKTSVQSAINWLKKPGNEWVADHDKMLNLLEKKLKSISQIQGEVHEELKNNVLTPKVDATPLVTEPSIHTDGDCKDLEQDKKLHNKPIPQKSSKVKTPSAHIWEHHKKLHKPQVSLILTPQKKIPEKLDFTQDTVRTNEILTSLEKINVTQGVIVSNDWKKAWKWSKDHPTIAKVQWETHTTLWWDIHNSKRSIYILDNTNKQVEASFILDQKSVVADKKVSNPLLDISKIPFTPKLNIQTVISEK